MLQAHPDGKAIYDEVDTFVSSLLPDDCHNVYFDQTIKAGEAVLRLYHSLEVPVVNSTIIIVMTKYVYFGMS